MPIIEPHVPDEPLNQGDLLRGVKLFLTGKADALTGGECVQSKSDQCVVLSRPCVTAHKGSVIVAAVEKWSSQTPAVVNTFERAKDYLTAFRDGRDTPDVFYLGQLPGKEADGRYIARFDSIHTLQIPQKPDVRKSFLEKHRFAKLHPDFSRDLHTRFFQSIATLGFEDISWFSDADLHFLVEFGKAELGSLQSEKTRLVASNQADGGKGNDIKSVENRIGDLEKKLQPYQAELELRKNVAKPS